MRYLLILLLAFPALAHEMVVEAAIDRKVVIVGDAITVHPTSHQFAPMDKECAAHLRATTGPDQLKHSQQRAPLELIECLQKYLKRGAPFVTHGEIRYTPVELEVDLGGDVSIGINP